MARGRPRKDGGEKSNKTKLGFEATLFAAADKLRSNMDAGEYKHVVLGLIFLKFISDRFERQRAKVLETPHADPEDRDEYLADNVFWVPKEARWSHVQANAPQPQIGQIVDDAMYAIERENASLKDVLPKNYARADLNKTSLAGVINLLADIDTLPEANGGQDVLGRVYEYFLGRFAAAEGKSGGQFYTPACVVNVLVEMLQPFKGRVYDPCCGSGGMFVQSERFVEAHGGRLGDISIYGQESNPTTWRLAKMNLAIRGIDANLGQRAADTFHDDLFPDLKADFVLSNPPFNDSDWGGERRRSDVRWKYGVPPTGNANFGWVQHFVHHLAPHGLAGFVMANGSMSSSQAGEGDIRRALIEADLVDCIVSLPTQLFYTTQIPVCLWFLARDKSNGILKDLKLRDRRRETLFIDARALGRMEGRVLRVFDEADIVKVSETYHAWREGRTDYRDQLGFCRSVSTEDIAMSGFILTPGRFVGVEDAQEATEPFAHAFARLRAELEVSKQEAARLDNEIEAALAACRFCPMWRDCTLGDVLTLQRGFDLPEQQREPGRIPIIASNGPVGHHSKHMVEGPGVVIGRSGSIGGGQFIREPFWPLNTTLWVKDFKGNDPRFCYYLLKSLDFSWANAGSGVPTLNRNHIHPTAVRCPPLVDQQAITRVLGPLDDQVDAIRRMNETLEGIARALFRNWFLDFDHPEAALGHPLTGSTGPISGGGGRQRWKQGRLDSILQLHYGKALSAEVRTPGDVPVYGSGGVTGRHNVALVEGPGIVVGRKGTVGSLFWEDRPFFPIDTVFFVRSAMPLTYCYYLLQTLGLETMNTDAAVPGLNRENVYRLSVPVPPSDMVAAFDDIAKPLRQRILVNLNQARSLVGLRDLLLPKLMSGAVRVKDAEQHLTGSM